MSAHMCCLVPYVADSPRTRRSHMAGDPLTAEIQDLGDELGWKGVIKYCSCSEHPQ